jgi:peroxiredoxin
MVLNGKTLAAIAAIFVLTGAILFAVSRPSVSNKIAPGAATDSEAPPPAAGDKAADFHLTDLDGKTVSLSSFRGKVVFLNLWATWCGPCREEMPSMETLYEELKGNKDFVMLGVSEDEKGKSVVLPYVQKNGYHFDILLDPENKVGDSYGVSGVPETFIIDRQGRIVAHHMGGFDWSRQDVREALQELLDAKKG